MRQRFAGLASRSRFIVRGHEQRHDAAAVLHDDVSEPTAAVRAGVPVDDVRGSVRRRNVAWRRIEQQTKGTVEAFCRLLERHRRSDQTNLQRAVPVVPDGVPRQRIGRRQRSVQQDDVVSPAAATTPAATASHWRDSIHER